MNPDYFESSTVSAVLSWVVAAPVAIYLVTFGLRSLLQRTEGMPLMYIAWLLLCIVVLSPFRYILFQVVAGAAFPFQSFVALLDTVPLALYVPIVFGILYAIGLVLPVLLITAIASTKHQVKKSRLVLSSLLAPFILYLATLLFFLTLPLGSWTIHWLKAEEVIRATNGPAFCTYQYLSRWGMPIRFPAYPRTVGQNDKEMFRSHVAAVYLSDAEQVRYLEHAHPAFSETPPNGLARVTSLWWKPEYRSLVEAVRSAENRTLSVSYRTGPKGEGQTNVTLSIDSTGGLVAYLQPPGEAFSSVNPDSKQEPTGNSSMVIIVRDHDLDGTPDDFTTSPASKLAFEEHFTEDGFIIYRDGPDHQSILVLWSIGMGYSINHFLKGIDSVLPQN